MRVRWGYLIVITLLACKSVRPDTITTKDNLSIHGSLSGLAGGVLKIKARFPSEVKEVSIKIQDVQTIEFNSLDSNPGAPPKIVGFGPPRGKDGSESEPPTGGVIVLRGGARHSCNLVGIDAGRVHCDPNDSGYTRNTVLRIELGSE